MPSSARWEALANPQPAAATCNFVVNDFKRRPKGYGLSADEGAGVNSTNGVKMQYAEPCIVSMARSSRGRAMFCDQMKQLLIVL